MSDLRDDFYVGYLPHAPAPIGRRALGAAAVLLVVVAVVAVALVVGQGEAAGGVFEFQVYRRFTGIVVERPYPTLLVARPGAGGDEPFSRYLLVGAGKHGASREVDGRNGQVVTLEGALVYRDGTTMIEVVPATVASASTSAGPGVRTVLEEIGTVTLRGEIVDSKCFLGVMNPGSTKPHRACAVRCISGGAPPLLIVSDGSDTMRPVLLATESNEALNRAVLDYVAEPVEITGRLVRDGDMEILLADPSSIKRSD